MRADELRRALVRNARALETVCEDAARLHEHLATRRPARVDHRLTAKRWRAVAEDAEETARTWEPEPDEPPVAADPDALDQIVRDLHAAGLRLHRVLDRSDGPDAARVERVLGIVDACVGGVRLECLAREG